MAAAAPSCESLRWERTAAPCCVNWAKKGGRYNAFDIFQDGNTVKRILATNQWLIYWLRTYKDEVGENFETSCVIQLKGIYTGARFYATVTINDCPMVAEPVRRTEDFEAESIKQ